jgi:hypothetical protein
LGSSQLLEAPAIHGYFYFYKLVCIGPGHRRHGAAHRAAAADQQGEKSQLVSGHIVGFLVLHRAGSGATQDADAHLEGFVRQYRAIRIAGHCLVIDRFKTILCLGQERQAQ